VFTSIQQVLTKASQALSTVWIISKTLNTYTHTYTHTHAHTHTYTHTHTHIHTYTHTHIHNERLE